MGSAFRALHKGQGGFTLVELLVVIAILGILMAVVVPNFTGLIARGSTESKAAELRTMQTVVDAFMSDTRVSTITATTITPANYNSGTFSSYLRAAPACNYSVAATGAVTRDTTGQPATCPN